jgi:uncharacterized membrane protein
LDKPKPDITFQQQNIAVSVQNHRPLLPANELAEYENVKEGFAERLFQMAEKEQNARLERENSFIRLSQKSLSLSLWGMVFGLLSVIIIAGLCAYIAQLGDAKAASAIAVAVIVGLAGVFVSREYLRKKSEEKEEE